jgi:hypothetical protein
MASERASVRVFSGRYGTPCCILEALYRHCAGTVRAEEVSHLPSRCGTQAWLSAIERKKAMAGSVGAAVLLLSSSSSAGSVIKPPILSCTSLP